MKQLYPTKIEGILFSIRAATITVAFSFITMVSFSQEPIFNNSILSSGIAESDGRIHRPQHVIVDVNSVIVDNRTASPLLQSDSVASISMGFSKTKILSYNIAKLTTLPVVFQSFTAQLNITSNKALLNWSTSSELNANHFVLQRSTDGENYDDMAIIFAREGNSNSLRQYNYSDPIASVNSSLVYYRLKVVDMNGNFEYADFELIKLPKQSKQSNILAYPNPSQSELRITIPDSWQGKSVSYHVYNVHGSLLKQKICDNAGQMELLNIADLPVGIYIVKAVNGNQTSVQRIVKLNN